MHTDLILDYQISDQMQFNMSAHHDYGLHDGTQTEGDFKWKDVRLCVGDLPIRPIFMPERARALRAD